MVGEEELAVATFRETSPETRSYRRRKLVLRGLQRRACPITIEALEIDFICPPVPAPNASLAFQLQQKECWLADNRSLKQNSRDAELSLLIGMDHYWDIMVGQVYPGEGKLGRL